jgi:serine/threonine protein kinase
MMKKKLIGLRPKPTTTAHLKRILSQSAEEVSVPKRISVDNDNAPKQIPKTSFEIFSKIGSGTFSNVYQGEYDGRDVAIKYVFDEPEKDAQFESHQVQIMIELNQLKIPNIIPLLAFTSTVLPYCIVMPYMRQGSLASHLESDEPRLSASICCSILEGISKALAYMHQYLIIHGDIKLENVLLDDTFHSFLADFDSAMKIDVEHNNVDNADLYTRGTLMYLAPEIIQGKPYTKSADVYAFAILMWEVEAWKFCGDDLLKLSRVETLQKVALGYREVLPAEWPASVSNLIALGWHQEQERRPSMRDVHEQLEKRQSCLNL